MHGSGGGGNAMGAFGRRRRDRGGCDRSQEFPPGLRGPGEVARAAVACADCGEVGDLPPGILNGI